MEKQGNIFEAFFESLANIMDKQETFCDGLFAALCKKCREHKEYMLVGIVTILSVGLFFLIISGIFSKLLIALLIIAGVVGFFIVSVIVEAAPAALGVHYGIRSALKDKEIFVAVVDKKNGD